MVYEVISYNIYQEHASPNFKVREFKCPCCGEIWIDTELLEALEALRARFNQPVIVNSGYRCERHNHAVGGASYSYHMQGMAADIKIKKIKPKALYEAACEIMGNHGGVILYDWGIHIDNRRDYHREDKR